MRAVKFKEANKVLTKPEGWTDDECFSLHVWNDGQKSISCWKPSIRERIKLLFTGKIWLWVYSGYTAPPVLVDVRTPFIYPHPNHSALRQLWLLLTTVSLEDMILTLLNHWKESLRGFSK